MKQKLFITLESEDQYSMAHVLLDMVAHLVSNKFETIKGKTADFPCPVTFNAELIYLD